MQRLIISIPIGLAVMTGFPPFEWTIVSWAGIVGLVYVLTTAPSGRNARWTAYVFGLAFYGTLLSWLGSVELLALYPMVMLQAIPMIIVGTVVYRYRAAAPLEYVIAVAGSFALAEFIRVRWPYGGFPWGSLGLTVGHTPFRPSTQWIGASGWLVILLASAAVVVMLIQRGISWQPAAGMVGFVVVLGLAGNIWPAVPDGETRSVTIVQGNSPCPGTRCPNERTLIYESHLQLTQALEAGSTDLIVWPESSTGARTDPVDNPEIGAAIGAEAARIGAVMSVGGDRDAGPENFINASVVFDTTGEIIGEYRKRHPVPFGEYVPLRSLLDWIPALDRVPRDMVQGDSVHLFDVDGVEFGTVISYEGAFARYEREAVANGARVIVVATNEASFGDTDASDQFIGISRVRAAELGTNIVHAAVTGKSAFVFADGTVGDLTGLFETDVITSDVAVRDGGVTLYARWGDWFQVLAMFALGGVLIRDRMAGTVNVRASSNS